jgi:hypothetical protein
MPSKSTGPYKSKLFNLINRQSIIWGDRIEKSARQLKVAVEWGAQILLYPIYLVVQASRMAALQLGQKIERWQAPLPSSEEEFDREVATSDKPITRILEAIESWLPTQLPEANIPSSPLASCDRIYGIASLLETHSIVLVTNDSQILDIFDRQQQNQLQQQIAWEVANHSRERRLAKLATYQSARQLPPISATNPHLILPIRLFWQAMEWLQNSSVAISVNFFGEANLFLPSSNLNLPNLPNIALHFAETGILTNIDNTVAEIEARQQISEEISISEEGIEANKLQLQALIQAAIDYFFSKKGWQFSDRDNLTIEIEATEAAEVNYLPENEEWLSQKDLFIEPEPQLVSSIEPFSKLDKPVEKLTEKQSEEITTVSEIAPSLSEAEPDSFKIQALIFAAIDYFFGKKQQNTKKITNSPQRGLTNNLDRFDVPAIPKDNFFNLKRQSQAIEIDPWLAEENKETEKSAKIKENSIEQSSKPNQLPSAVSAPLLKNNVENSKRKGKSKQENKINKAKFLKQTTNNKQQPSPPDPLSYRERGRNREREITDKISLPSQPIKPSNLSKDRDISSQIIPSANKNNTTVTFAEAKETKIEMQQDWLETEAKPIGYVKHPLEIILEWLDRIMLWLEEVAVKIWRWLQKRLKDKK